MTRFLKLSVATLMSGAALVSMAQAGGYGRGSANLDPLLEEGTVAASSFAIIAPKRGIASVDLDGAGPGPTINAKDIKAVIGGQTYSVGDKFTETFTNFTGTVAFDMVGNVRCAGSYAQPFGSDADYGYSRLFSGISTTTSASLKSDELGLTCSYGADIGPGKAHFLGGVFYQALDYQEARAFGFKSPLNGADLALEDGSMGYRFGAAYTITEIALKASLMYRSAVDHHVEGLQRFTTDVDPGPGVLLRDFQLPVYADATLPQSVKLALQSGIAPGWLAFGSVEWTDWSVLQQVRVKCAIDIPGLCLGGNDAPGAPTVDAYFKDGWTVNAGVGHKFNDLISGSFSVTYDSGVSDYYDGATRSSFGDTWTMAVGAAFTPNANASIRAGLAYSYLAPASETNSKGQVLNFDADHSISGGISASIKF
jgi:long-chain fatty acid transport protein